jgi:glyoxylase I family protein
VTVLTRTGGLDHLSFSVATRGDPEQAIWLFDEHGVTHRAITRLPSFGIDVLPFDDPDGSQPRPGSASSSRPRAVP